MLLWSSEPLIEVDLRGHVLLGLIGRYQYAVCFFIESLGIPPSTSSKQGQRIRPSCGQTIPH